MSIPTPKWIYKRRWLHNDDRVIAHGSGVWIFSLMFRVDPSHSSANSFLTQDMTIMGPNVDGTCVYNNHQKLVSENEVQNTTLTSDSTRNKIFWYFCISGIWYCAKLNSLHSQIMQKLCEKAKKMEKKKLQKLKGSTENNQNILVRIQKSIMDFTARNLPDTKVLVVVSALKFQLPRQ